MGFQEGVEEASFMFEVVVVLEVGLGVVEGVRVGVVV